MDSEESRQGDALPFEYGKPSDQNSIGVGEETRRRRHGQRNRSHSIAWAFGFDDKGDAGFLKVTYILACWLIWEGAAFEIERNASPKMMTVAIIWSFLLLLDLLLNLNTIKNYQDRPRKVTQDPMDHLS